MNFGNVFVVFLLPITAIFCYSIFYLGEKKRIKLLKIFMAKSVMKNAISDVSDVRKKTKKWFSIIAFLLIWFGMSLPRVGYEFVEKRSVGVDILFAVDVSKSMLAEDIKPSRLERTKLEIEKFLQRFYGNRVGLIAFAGNAFLQCPLTLDFAAFLQSVDALDTNVIFNGGTSLDKVVMLSDKIFNNNSNKHILIIFSDGEELSGNVLSKLKTIKNLQIFTIGVGDTNGSKLPITQDDGSVVFVKDRLGKDVISKLNRKLLEQIADQTGGCYTFLSASGLTEIYEKFLQKFEKSNLMSYQEKVPVERYQIFVLIAIFLLLIEQMISTKKSEKIFKSWRIFNKTIVIIVVLFVSVNCFGIESNGDKFFAKNDFKQAAKYYENVLKKDKTRLDVAYDLGTSLLRDKNFEDSEKYLSAASETDDLNLKKFCFYNLGIANFELGDVAKTRSSDEALILWETSLRNFENAIELDENFENAVKNYKFVKQKIEELKKQQENQKNENNEENQEKGSESSNEQKNDQNKKQENENNEKNSEQNDAISDSNLGNNSQHDRDDLQKEKKDNLKKLDDVSIQESACDMTLQEAQIILDDVRKNERKFPLILNEKNEKQGNNDKDW